MIGALLYLRLTSLKNLLRSRLVRLRQPKYLIGAIVGGAYFYFFFFRHTQSVGKNPRTDFFALPPDSMPVLVALAGFALLAVFLGLWLLPSGKPGLTFSEAEIAFLFPAPLSRRGLVHYRVISSQFTALLQSLLYALLFHQRNLFSPQALQIILSWWAVLSIISLHYQGASLTIARLVESGIHHGRRRAVILLVVASIALACAWPVADGIAGLTAAHGFIDWARAVLHSGALPWLLWPFTLIVAPFVADGPVNFLLALTPVLLLLAAHYFWIVRLNVSFEEASIEKAERGAARLAELRRSGVLHASAPRTAGRRPPFNLARSRWPELAFLWKNLLSTSRPWFTPRTWLICAGLVIAFSVIARLILENDYWKAGAALTTIGTMTGGIALLYGPLFTRLDLRQDLANADLLKTYPLPGWRILLGQLLTPIAILTGIVWLCLLAWYLGLQGHQPPHFSPTWLNPNMRLVFTLCAAVVTPAIIAMELLIPNAVPLLFPAWFHAIRTPGGGIDLMGQRLIFAFGQVFVVTLALLPAAGAAAFLIFVTQWLVGPALSVVFSTVVVTLVLLGELWCGLWWLGGRFERFDLSTESSS